MDARPTARSATGFLSYVLIEPRVYVRVFDLDFQAEQFDVFHRSAPTRLVHYLGTQAIVGACLLLASGVSVLGVGGQWWLAGALCVWFLAMHLRVGLVASLPVLVWTVVAAAGRSSWAWGSREAVIVLVVAAAAQNLSHAPEPVPPVLTGRGFEPFATYWSRAAPFERARLLGLNAFYLPLELVSAPRLFPVHVLRALQAVGFLRDEAADVRRRADAILAGRTGDSDRQPTPA